MERELPARWPSRYARLVGIAKAQVFDVSALKRD